MNGWMEGGLSLVGGIKDEEGIVHMHARERWQVSYLLHVVHRIFYRH